jgi:hypothetical protein
MVKPAVIKIPQALHNSQEMRHGDSFTLLDLGSVLVLSPRRSEIDMLAEQMRAPWTEEGETLETMLQAPREARDRRGR